MNEYIGKSVLVRDNGAGIHVGLLESFDPATKCCTLRSARKVWYWQGAASCHGIAVRGIKHSGSKVCPAVAIVTMTQVVEIVLCSEIGAKSVMEAPEWTP